MAAPRATILAEISWLASGAMELMSTRIEPGRMPSDHAAFPEDGFLHFRGIRQHRDDDLRLRGDILARTRRLGAGGGDSCTGSGRTSQTTNSYPFFSKFLAMGLPMMPRADETDLLHALSCCVVYLAPAVTWN